MIMDGYRHGAARPLRDDAGRRQRDLNPAPEPLPKILARGPTGLPVIPVVDTGPGFPLATLAAQEQRAHHLFDSATRGIPVAALRALDDVSRRWMTKWDNAHLAEIDEIAARLGRPGTHFLSVNYEWACTCTAKPSPDGKSARLIRVLDWRTPGLGRNVMAARVEGAAGRYVTLTWPGYTGVIQAMAPGRFSAALNQAPMRFAFGLMPIDWLVGRAKLWKMPHPTASHTLRRVFDAAATFTEAKRMLIDAPIAAPAIFILAGLEPDETCVIERTETSARVFGGAAVAANHWQPELPGAYEWRGRHRGINSPGRALMMQDVDATLDPGFAWLKSPVLNHHTRLVMVADARAGRLVARGYETDGEATQPLELAA
jgi:hypothetical protein